MARAFVLLQEQRQDGGEPVVSQATWKRLVRLVQPDISNAQRELLWSVSDDQGQGCIGGSRSVSCTRCLCRERKPTTETEFKVLPTS